MYTSHLRYCILKYREIWTDSMDDLVLHNYTYIVCTILQEDREREREREGESDRKIRIKELQ